MKALRLLITILVTAVLGPLGAMNLYYGVFGISAGLRAHEGFSSGALVFWALFLIGIYCWASILWAWMRAFRRNNREELNLHS